MICVEYYYEGHDLDILLNRICKTFPFRIELKQEYTLQAALMDSVASAQQKVVLVDKPRQRNSP
jgi:hypothetical protein